MGQDKVGIANLAIRMVGGKRISSFNDGSVEADVISDCYDFFRDECLEVHPWSFSLLTIALNQLSAVPINPGADQFTIAYALPNNFLKGYKISIPGARFKFSMMDISGSKVKVMLADSATLQLQYLYRNDDPSTYSPQFCTALATRIAAGICFTLTQATKKAALLEQLFKNETLPNACSSDSQQGTPELIAQDDWQIERLAGGRVGPVTPGAHIWQNIW